MANLPVGVKTATKTALESFKDLYEGPRYEDLALEEIQLEGTKWMITVGYSVPSRTPLISAAPYREYKTIEIDGVGGQFISMKIRKP